MNGQAQDAIVLKHANLIDGLSDQPLRDVTVVVENGRVTSLAKTEKTAAGAPVIDLSGRWVLPGLIDAHVHVSALEGARAMVAAGVPTIRTMQVDHYIDVGIRELHRGGAKDLPECCRRRISTPPGHVCF
jgi:imidazolonepropionase-like amidohydrolase